MHFANQAAVTWIAGAIVGFLIWWPIGVAILACVLITALSQQFNRQYIDNVMPVGWRVRVGGSTGNTAFDQYREDTLRQLEADQLAFGGFMDKLRRAKDRAEFDQFMKERRP